MKISADFETTTYLDEKGSVRVWAYGLCEVGNVDNFKYGNSIESFLNFCSGVENHEVYFHNLKFDGEFILSHLLANHLKENNFTHVLSDREAGNKTFTTLISGKGQFYRIVIYFKKQGHHVNKVTIFDSLKIIPFGVKEIAKSFNLPIKKGEINYHSIRNEGHIITKDELDYLRNDVQIVGMALQTLFSEGLDKMTQGSNALADYIKIIGKKNFDKYFPIPDYDADIRTSYRGGFTYCNPKYKGVEVGEGIVLDVNSLYPSVMYYQKLPYGEGKRFQGKYVDDKMYDLYVQAMVCQFTLKKDHIPTLQLKNNLAFVPTEYLTSSGDEEVPLSLTSVDLKLLFEHYDVFNIEYLGGWKFKSTVGLFKDYIDKWTARKVQAKEDGNGGQYVLAKLMLNALYGKFALNPKVSSKIPFLNSEGIVKYIQGEEELRNPIYIPVGTFITSYARYKTITTAQKCFDRFIYSDTDSLHLLGTELPEGVEISPTDLGKWDHENTFKKAKFLRQKSYFETIIVSDKSFNKMDEEHQDKCYMWDKDTRVVDCVTCAGMSERSYQYVTFDNFKVGQSYEGKLQHTHVKGGIILKDTTFQIKK